MSSFLIDDHSDVVKSSFKDQSRHRGRLDFSGSTSGQHAAVAKGEGSILNTCDKND
jgi:hypothetical protein